MDSLQGNAPYKLQEIVRWAGQPQVEASMDLVEVLGAFGDFLRTRRLAEGYGFELKEKNVSCQILNCSFAPAAEVITQSGAVCAVCPINRLFMGLLRKQGWKPRLLAHETRTGSEVTCRFVVQLERKHEGHEVR